MTYEFQYLLGLVGAAAQGLHAMAPDRAVDWEKMIAIAREQTVLPLAAYAIKHTDIADCPAIILKGLIQEYQGAALREFLRRDKVLALLGTLYRENVPAVLLKGMGVSVLYAVPECRASADIDIYVGEDNEKRARDILVTNGVLVGKRNPKAQEAVCYHPQIGCIELHAHLFGEDDRKIWFRDDAEYVGINEPYVKVRHGDGFYYTLGPMDNAVFLSLHLVKHFIRGGTNLRHMMDITLFLKANFPILDGSLYWEKMQALKVDGIIHTILNIMQAYCNFLIEDFPGVKKMPQELLVDFLTDVENGGWMGRNEESARRDSAMAYDRFVFMKKRSKHKIAYLMHRRGFLLDVIRGVFCPAEILRGRYPFFGRSLLFLPVAWLCHLLTGVFKFITGRVRPVFISSNAALSKVSQNRIRLFDRIGLF